jgi:hypothetical protein
MKKKEIVSELINDDGKIVFKVGGDVIKYNLLNYRIHPDSNKTKCDVNVDDNEYVNVNYIDKKSERFKMSGDELQDSNDKDRDLFLNSIKAKVKGGNV